MPCIGEPPRRLGLGLLEAIISAVFAALVATVVVWAIIIDVHVQRTSVAMTLIFFRGC